MYSFLNTQKIQLNINIVWVKGEAKEMHAL